MVPDTFHDFFVAEAGASAALIGLLFVAISVSQDRVSRSMVEQARASSALTCFLVPLALSLVGLLPDSHVSIPAIVFSAAGLLFVVGTLRRFFSLPRGEREDWRGLVGLFGFSAAMAVILVYGIFLAIDATSPGALSAIAAATVASLLLGVERAWALIGGRGTGRGTALRDIVRGEARPKK